MITITYAAEQATLRGATADEIAGYARVFEPQVGSVFYKNMIRALNLHPWNNTRDDWARLAGALKARKLCRS